MTVFGLPHDPPPDYRNAVVSMQSARIRPEVVVHSVPAPLKIAPFGVAVEADVVIAGEETGSGRFIVLHDPVGVESWQGVFRVISYASATLEPEFTDDECLGGVGWSWLTESLERQDAAHHALGGTVTREINESFGELAGSPPELDMQIRASWTPTGHNLGAHYVAWTDLLCTMSGLPPMPEGVTALSRRNR